MHCVVRSEVDPPVIVARVLRTCGVVVVMVVAFVTALPTLWVAASFAGALAFGLLWVALSDIRDGDHCVTASAERFAFGEVLLRPGPERTAGGAHCRSTFCSVSLLLLPLEPSKSPPICTGRGPWGPPLLGPNRDGCPSVAVILEYALTGRGAHAAASFGRSGRVPVSFVRGGLHCVIASRAPFVIAT